jgi:hypothetical protein
MNLHAFRSAARAYFADEATDEASITEECTTPSPPLSIQSLLKSALASLISLGRPSPMRSQVPASECKCNQVFSPAMPAEERLGRITGPRLDPDQATAVATSDSAN